MRDEVEAPATGQQGCAGGSVGRSGGCGVGGPKGRGVGPQPSLPCDAQPGAGATVGICGLAECPFCLGGNGLTGAVLGIHDGPRQVLRPWDGSLPLPIRQERFGR